MTAESSSKAESSLVAEFGAVTADLASVLAEADVSAEVVWRGEGELRPEHVEFLYQPPARAASRNSDKFREEERSRPPAETLPPNAACTLCKERMYPVRQYKREGKIPILVLHHAGPAPGAKVRTDKSAKFVLGSKEEDDVFARMLTAAGLEFDGPHYQEFPACHFNAERSTQPDWQRRASNCLVHVAQTVTASGIRLIVACGHAAVALLGEEKAAVAAKSGTVAPVEFGGDVPSLPCLVIRSPSAILALETRRKAQAPDSDKLKELVEQEKEIKQRLLASLSMARKLARV